MLLASSRLATLTGVGGVGKTRLALRVAANAQRSFPDGVFLAQLADLNDPGLVPQVVAIAVGLRDHSGDPVAALSGYLVDKQALLVLDNCEHLCDACGFLISELLQACPQVRVLATSRQALRIAGEQVFVVPPLSTADPDQPMTPDDLEQYEAARLFMDRATAILPNFALTPENCSAVARLCQALDGVPLAVELAAARLPVLSPKQMLDRIEDRFDLLSGGSRRAPPRQQTLSAMVGWSFDLCSANEQLLWSRMSVFPGSFDLQSVEAVCSDGALARQHIFEAVDGLVDKSILIRGECADEARFRMLETIRQYGRRKLREQERTSLQRRHRDWYQSVSTRAGQEWFGASQVEWLTRLQSDQPNLRAALEFSFSSAGETTTGLDLASGLWFYWIASGLFSEGRRWLERGLESDHDSTPARAWALWVCAWLAAVQGDFRAAMSMLDEARAIGSVRADSTVLTYVIHTAGLCAMLQGDLRLARARFEEALGRHRRADNTAGVVDALNLLSVIASLLGDITGAAGFSEECLSLCDAYGERWYKSYALGHHGIALLRQGDVGRAAAVERESLRLHRCFNQKLGIGISIEALSWIGVANGQYQHAARLFGSLREIWRSIGAPPSGLGYLAGYHEQCIAQVREKLDKRTFDNAWRIGSGLDLDTVVASELGEQPTAPVSATPAAPLTLREQEVADLLADGQTNKEIAATLVISRRTVESHVEHILVKLGFTSRSQVAVWVTKRRIAPGTASEGKLRSSPAIP
ncbi:LuxR C-terminal-related transcriptional regulator [Saccharopolyspora shandongensis]|uniref:ATP-binding protein n=1 Tax=Saccharopolyspora shandongensis TaxID=418495 RepID=UPI00343D5290